MSNLQREFGNYIGNREITSDTKCIEENGNENTPYILGSKEYEYISHREKNSASVENCMIKNIPQQRWNCISMNVHNNIVDIFLDKELINTTTFSSAIEPVSSDIILGPNRGFDGFITSLSFSNKNLNPEEIKKLYKKGPKIFPSFTDWLKNLLGKK